MLFIGASNGAIKGGLRLAIWNSSPCKEKVLQKATYYSYNPKDINKQVCFPKNFGLE